MQSIKIAQIGCGYWGPNILRSLRMLNSCELKTLVEINIARKKFVRAEYPGIYVTDKITEVLEDDEIKAVIIATPAATHYQLSKLCLDANKHVLVEKPMATNLFDALELKRISYEKKLILMVGHVFLYNPAVVLLKKIIQDQSDDLYYFYSQRLNFGKIRDDVNVWWNLAPHDLSILLYLMNEQEPISIKVEGFNFTESALEDIAFATIKWKNNVTANIHLSWLDPRKVRQLTIVTSKKMIVYNDLIPDKIAIHEKSIDCENHFDDPGRVFFNHRVGNITFPKIDMKEPLLLELEHFINSVLSSSSPKTGPMHACRVVNLLDAGQCSIINKGAEIAVKSIEEMDRKYAESTI